MRILVVEDESDMAALLRQGLEEEGHSVVVSPDGRDAVSIASRYELDAILLDVMLPGIDGYTVARKLRESKVSVPILMLTARDSASDVTHGLDTGADDYLTKPFSFDVLLARLRSITRRGNSSRPPVFQVADLLLDPSTHDVTRAGRPIALTKTEYVFLELLMRRAGQVVTREVILDSVWGFDQDVGNNTIDAFVHLLRLKIDQQAQPKLLHTVRGLGYILRQDPYE